MSAKPVTPINSTEVRRKLGYLGAEEICALLGIGMPTLRNRLSCGTAPPSHKVGNEHLFRVSEVDAWIRQRRAHRAAA